MQIIPTLNTNSTFSFFSGAAQDSGSSFMDAMSDALGAVDGGEYSSVSSALENNREKPRVESPYSRHTTDGVTYTLSEVCFTKQELMELREQLLKEGAPVESLKQFDILAGQPDGATLAQVMASLTGSKTNQFSEDDALSIVSLLKQIDPSGQLGENALDLMRKGDGAGALELIQNALADMGADMGIDIDPDSLMALGRGLGLDNDTLANLAGALKGQSLTVNAAMFDALMQPAKSQFLAEAANANKLNAALDKTLKPIISKARDRMEKEEAASALSGRRVEQSKILIDETVQKNSREMMDKTVSGEAAEEREAHGSGLESMGLAVNRLEDVQAQNAQNSRQARNDQSLQTAWQSRADTTARNYSGDSAQDFTGRNQDNHREDEGWRGLLDKVSVKSAETAKPAARADSIVYSMLEGNLAQTASFNTLGAEMPAPLASHLANQVEQGLLTAMRDGATRLDLQLHPAELGSIAVTLIARNGEITAQIRSEKSETAELVSKQLDTIRVNLEQQGLKVDKIEVQLENKGENSGNSFDNLEQHNARQEESAFRQDLQRLRNLAAVRKLDADGNNMAQNMQDMRRQAIYAAQGLHVVA